MNAFIRTRASLATVAACVAALTVPPLTARAQNGAAASEIPAAMSAALHEARIPSSAVGLVVAPLDDDGSLKLAVNPAAPMNPASTMKLLTTYAALNLLGPTFQWRTEVY